MCEIQQKECLEGNLQHCMHILEKKNDPKISNPSFYLRALE